MGRFSIRTSLMSLLPILIIFIVAGPANAQGLFGTGLPGSPSFSGSLVGPSGSGEKLFPHLGTPFFYVGWMEDRQGTTFSAYATAAPGGGAVVRYPNRGLWVGLAESMCWSDSLCFTASGWYLVSSNATGGVLYDFTVPPSGRSWETDTQWWFVDGLFAIGAPGGLSILGGMRYDHYTSRFKNSFDVTAGLLPNYLGDVVFENWIPLVGTEYTYRGSAGSLLFRAVGFPAVFGNYKFVDSDTANTVISDGKLTKGYFVELFVEYSKKFGPAAAGLFAKWNALEGNSKEDTIVINFQRSPHDATVNRSSWTIGGNFSLNW